MLGHVRSSGARARSNLPGILSTMSRLHVTAALSSINSQVKSSHYGLSRIPHSPRRSGILKLADFPREFRDACTSLLKAKEKRDLRIRCGELELHARCNEVWRNVSISWSSDEQSNLTRC